MKKVLILFLVLVMAVSFVGCGGAAIKKESVSQLNKIGLLSVSLGKSVPESASNSAVMQRVVTYASKSLQSSLKSVNSFKTIPYSTYATKTDFINMSDIAKSRGAQAYLKHLADTDPQFVMGGSVTNMQDLAAMFSGGSGESDSEKKTKAIKNATKMLQGQLDKEKKHYITASGMPFLPYFLFNDSDPNRVVIKAGNANEDKNYLKDMMLSNVGSLCKKLGLDAMAVVHVYATASPLTSVRIIHKKDYALGHIKLNMTMLLINRDGEIIADMGHKVMDDLAPMKMNLPFHKITERKGKHISKTVLDLKDPWNKTAKAYYELSKETSTNLVKDLRKGIGEIE